MDAIFDLIKEFFTPILDMGWSCHYVDHFDNIGSTFWSEILQSA